MIGTPSLPPNYTLGDLENLNNNSAYYDNQVQYTNIRERALREASQALGMQAALNYESTQIDAILRNNEEELDQIFDFNQVMYQDNVMPPVITKASNLVNINPTGDTIRIAGQTYNIITPAKFVTSPPTWRDYLWQSYPPASLPDKSVLPENSKEQAFWQANIVQGWDQGINQAIAIFGINLNILVRDFNGMLLYKQMLVQNKVSPYYVNRTEHGITGNAHHMVIDDQTLQITAQPELLYQSKRWGATPISTTPAPPQAPATPVATPSTPPTLEDALDKAVEPNELSK